MLIITVAVGLLPLVSTTVNAASYEYPYITVLTDASGESIVYLSSTPMHVYCSTKNLTNYDEYSPYYFYIGTMGNDNLIRIDYNTKLLEWTTTEIYMPDDTGMILYVVGGSTYYNYGVRLHGDSASDLYKVYSCQTNSSMNSYEQKMFSSYSSNVSSLPHGLTQSQIEDIVDAQINTQTSVGRTAQTIIDTTASQYDSYLAGDIDSAAMLENVTNNIDSLSNLTPSTLMDAIQINNGITYNQSIQDQILNNASDRVTALFDQYIRLGASYTYYRYQQGEITQQQANQNFYNHLRGLSNELTSGNITSIADIEAVNAMINMIQSYLDMVHNEKDLNVDVSDKVQQSDQEELDYLDQLESETTSTIEQLAPSQNFTGAQTGDAQEVLELVWDNEFVKRLIPMCAGFMVVCVVLGIRYKV